MHNLTTQQITLTISARPEDFKPSPASADIVDDLISLLTNASTVIVDDIVDPAVPANTTVLPWRIVYRGNITLTALDHYPSEDELFAALAALQHVVGHDDDSISALSVMHSTTAI